MALKTYLDFGSNWHQWYIFADALFALKVPQSEMKVDPEVHGNIFLQSWKTYLNKKQSPISKQITDTAKKFNLQIEGIAFSRNIIQDMPIWYHKEGVQAIRIMNSTAASQCLKQKHKLHTVGEAADLAALDQIEDHTPTSSCGCHDCESIRKDYNCTHPYGCICQCIKLLKTL
ncbi:hypothetical protein F5050DRAFT_1556763, partial [Lentinula boryana]